MSEQQEVEGEGGKPEVEMLKEVESTWNIEDVWYLYLKEANSL